MKTLPLFIENYVSTLSSSNKETFIQLFSLWNKETSFSPSVNWYEGGEKIKKFSLYKVPAIIGDQFAKNGKKMFARKEQKNLWNAIIRSDYGLNFPLHFGASSLAFHTLADMEQLLLSFSLPFHSPKIFIGNEGRNFFGEIAYKESFSLLISGSIDESVATSFYVFDNGNIRKVSLNRHTLNYTEKLSNQLQDLATFCEGVNSYRSNFHAQSMEISATFDQLYSRILLKGGSTSKIKGRALGLYNGIKSHYVGGNTLLSFYDACKSYDLEKLGNDPTKILQGSFTQYSDLVRIYAENNHKLQKLVIK